MTSFAMSIFRRTWRLALALAVLVFVYQLKADLQQRGGGAAAPQSGGISIDATEDQIRQAFDGVRAGRKLTPPSWPSGARVAVALSFDVDNELLSRANPLPVPLSQGEYGAVAGLPRILSTLDRQQVPASFYIPAASAILHPEMIPLIKKSNRHEIGVHGWMHENLPSIGDPAVEARLLRQSIDFLTKAAGQRPVGYRAPSWAFSPHTIDQIVAAGFLYDSSMMAMDEPYEIVARGKPTGLIELPIEWILDDFPYYSGNASGSLPSPEAVYQIYKSEFDMAYEERTMMVLTMHPHVSGHRSRVMQLERLIVYMKSKPGVWFATLGQIASFVKSANKMP